MKKIAAIIISMILAASLVACAGGGTSTTGESTTGNAAESTANSAGEASAQDAKDVGFDCSALVPAKTKASESWDGGTLEFDRPPYANTKELAKDADIIIRGVVEEAEYVLTEKPCDLYTKSIVAVDEVYKGDVKKGDKITVSELGGFIPHDVYSNGISMEKWGTPVEIGSNPQIVEERVNGYKVMEKGEKVFLLLTKTSDSGAEGFGDGDIYSTLRVWQGKLLYNEEAGVYAPYIPEDEKDKIAAETFAETDLSQFAEL